MAGTEQDSALISQTAEPTPPWLRPDWDGSVVELRPADAGGEWPDAAVERITFSLEDLRDSTSYVTSALPFTEYFGADGWPLSCPESVKARLDPRMKAEVHRHPLTIRPELLTEGAWLREFHDLDTHRRLNAEAALFQVAFQEIGLPEAEIWD